MPWDKERLKELVNDKLQDYQIILVSNREPYMHSSRLNHTRRNLYLGFWGGT